MRWNGRSARRRRTLIEESLCIMYRVFEYGILFVVMTVLQVFVFSRIGLSVYVTPLAYVAFILLLPMEIPGALLLLLALLQGIAVDFFTGMAGVNTIASLFTAFCRPAALALMVGKDEVKDGGIPNTNRLGVKKFFRYATVLVVVHCAVFFMLEALSWSYFYLTLLRIVLSGAVTLLLVYFCQKLFSVNRRVRYGNAE